MNKANSTPNVKDSKMKNINKIMVAAIIALTAVACAPDSDSPEVAALKVERGRLQDSIVVIDGLLDKLDTAKITSLPKVSFHTTEAGPFHHYFSTQGFVESDKSIMLTPETGGLIRSITDKEGQEVPKGHVVATFDAAIVASNINELEEQMKLAEYNYNKQKSLFDQGVGTEFAL
ncbi:MAG: membrane fusion protein (multidrug efflux system), partial [Parvicellaceae bacterium]